VSVESCGDPGKGVDAIARSTAFFEPGNYRLGGTHPLSELALAESGFSSKVVDELTECEVLFNPGSGVSIRLGAFPLDIFPARVIGHRRLLQGCCRAHSFATLRL